MTRATSTSSRRSAWAAKRVKSVNATKRETSEKSDMVPPAIERSDVGPMSDSNSTGGAGPKSCSAKKSNRIAPQRSDACRRRRTRAPPWPSLRVRHLCGDVGSFSGVRSPDSTMLFMLHSDKSLNAARCRWSVPEALEVQVVDVLVDGTQRVLIEALPFSFSQLIEIGCDRRAIVRHHRTVTTRSSWS